jgi:hypothetical protein
VLDRQVFDEALVVQTILNHRPIISSTGWSTRPGGLQRLINGVWVDGDRFEIGAADVCVRSWRCG